MKDENINKDSNKKVIGSSCLSRYKHTSKLINGYSQMHSIERALGFNEPYDLQCSIKNSHLINASDIVEAVRWLFSNGFDVVKLKSQKTNK